MLRVKEILKEKGMTQIDLAKKLGISTVGLSKILNGDPKVTTLTKIANALDVSITDLFLTGGNKDFYGYLEYKGEIKKITTIGDIERFIKINE